MHERISPAQKQDDCVRPDALRQSAVKPRAASLPFAALQRALLRPTARTLTPDIMRVVQRTHGNRVALRLAQQAGLRPAPGKSAGSIQRYHRLEDTRGEYGKDNYQEIYLVWTDKSIDKDVMWKVQISTGHGYRPNHKPQEVFAPDITASGNVKEFVEAIIADIETRIIDGNVADGNHEFATYAAGETINYRCRVINGSHQVFVGTFFSPAK